LSAHYVAELGGRMVPKSEMWAVDVVNLLD
jgi:hypothetical protein